MSQPNQDDQTLYRVVVDEEERYSIWFDYQEIPPGWRDGGKIGTKQECLDYIKTVWTDMRPLSLRRWMKGNAAQSAPPNP
jgi:MbtH protein